MVPVEVVKELPPVLTEKKTDPCKGSRVVAAGCDRTVMQNTFLNDLVSERCRLLRSSPMKRLYLDCSINVIFLKRAGCVNLFWEGTPLQCMCSWNEQIILRDSISQQHLVRKQDLKQL